MVNDLCSFEWNKLRTYIIEDNESRFVAKVSFHLGHVVFLDQKVKTSKRPKYFSCIKVPIWLVNIISTEHDQ